MTRRSAWALAALGMLSLVLRLVFAIDYDEDVDSLRFALAVEDFDVASLRPHPPFYPVYVAAAKLVRLLLPTPQLALAVVGAVAGAATVVATALLAREVLGPRALLVAGALAALSPFLWLTSQKLMSDMTGTAVCTVALWLSARARRLADGGRTAEASSSRTVAVVTLGLLLGTRLSYFPVALACTAVVARAEGGGRAWLARLRDLGAGVALWLVPLIAVAGPDALVRSSVVQAAGHFTRWGGSVVTLPSPAARLAGALWGLWANVLGGAWPDAPAWRWLGAPLLLLLLVRALATRGAPRSWLQRQPELVIAGAAYLAWALLGQNSVHKPRHFAPLAPLLVVALTAGAVVPVARRRLALGIAALLGAQWALDAIVLVRSHQRPSPAAAIVAHLRGGGGQGATVLTCDLGRMIREGAPGVRVTVVPAPAALPRALEESAPTAERLLMTSECLGASSRDELARRRLVPRVVLERPRSRYVDPLWNELALVELVAAPPPAAAALSP